MTDEKKTGGYASPMTDDEIEEKISEGVLKGAEEDQKVLPHADKFRPGQHMDGSYLEADDDDHIRV